MITYICCKCIVGRLLLTKAPGKRDEFSDRDAEDITHQYKAKEHTSEERTAVEKAFRCLAG